jgi:molybdenum cofactor cytidylyltransferase
VDHPAVREDTIALLVSTFASHREAAAVIPRRDGKRGHPLIVGRALAAELLALPPTGQASQVIRSHGGDIVYVDVDDPGIHADVDTPADYAALRETSR